MNGLHIPVRGSGGGPRASTSPAHSGADLEKSGPVDAVAAAFNEGENRYRQTVLGQKPLPGMKEIPAGPCVLRLKSTSLYLMADYGLTNELRRARPFPNGIMAEGVGNSTLDGQWEIEELAANG